MTIRKGTRNPEDQLRSNNIESTDPDFKDPLIPELLNRVFRGDGRVCPKPTGPPKRVRAELIERKGGLWYKKNAEKRFTAVRPLKGGPKTEGNQGAEKMSEGKRTAEEETIFQQGVEMGRAETAAEYAARQSVTFGQKAKAFVAHNWGKAALALAAAGLGVAGDRYYQRNYANDANRGDNTGGMGEGGNR